MKGYRFYLEHNSKKDKRESRHNDNVVAINTDIPEKQGLLEGLVGVHKSKNSPVCWSTVGSEYLRTLCKRISEGKARVIHPALFRRLDN